MATSQTYWDPANTTGGTYAVTATSTNITTAKTGIAGFNKLALTNTTSAERTITIADDSDNTKCVISLAANAGNNSSNPQYNILSSGFLRGVTKSGDNLIYIMEPNAALRIKADATGVNLDWQLLEP